MKKTILFIALLTYAGSALFAEDDKVSINSISVNPGGEDVEVSVSLDNSATYTSFGMDLYLPDGYSFSKTENDDEDLVYTLKGSACKGDHSVSSELQSDGALRVTALSLSSSAFKSKSHDLFTFYIKANAWTKPGEATINVKKCSFTTPDAVQINAEDINLKVTTTTACTLPINVKAADKWGTITSPFEITAIPANITAYTIASTSGSEIKLTKASKIEAYKAYVLKASADVNTSINGTVDASAYEANVAGGLATDTKAFAVYTSQMVSSGPYVLQNQGEGAKFYAISGGIKVPAGKVFFHKEAGAKVLDFVVDEETDIKDIETIDSEAIYDIQGRRVETPKHGIYIVGGKKVRL